MTIQSPDQNLVSDSLFDSPPDFAFDVPSITEWRKEIPNPLTSFEDLPFPSDLQDMRTRDLFDFKDTISECSMDSAYQSQSGASRPRARKPERHTQDAQNRGDQAFTGSEMFSPSMGSEQYNFADPPMDLGHLPHAADSWEAPDTSVVYANYSAAQDLTHYANASAPRYSVSSGAASPWIATEAQFQNSNFTYASYPDMLFNQQASAMQQPANSQYTAMDRPSMGRNYSTYSMPREARRVSTNGSVLSPSTAAPTGLISVHLTQNTDFDPSRLVNSRHDTEDSVSTSLRTHSLDENEDVLSQSDLVDAKVEEERTKVARSDPLYQRGPDKDGKYHCPKEGSNGCNHKPTPLKCNYDKYVDSHLKPFRCNKKECSTFQFSSTACLLRHEREAHGMHGHGSRPHLCHFPECERAAEGNGFPRRYNLFDHMKRVHSYDGPAAEPSPPVATGTQRKSVSRKRKASNDDSSERKQKAMRLNAEHQRLQQREQLAQSFLNKKRHIIDILSKLSGPSDLRDDIQLTKEVVGLHEICTKFRENMGG